MLQTYAAHIFAAYFAILSFKKPTNLRCSQNLVAPETSAAALPSCLAPTSACAAATCSTTTFACSAITTNDFAAALRGAAPCAYMCCSCYLCTCIRPTRLSAVAAARCSVAQRCAGGTICAPSCCRAVPRCAATQRPPASYFVAASGTEGRAMACHAPAMLCCAAARFCDICCRVTACPAT